MIRVVADTNVYISALMFGGLPGTFLELALVGSFVLVTSEALLDELDEKLRIKFGVSSEDAAAIRARLDSTAHIVKPDLALDVVKADLDDNRVLECALAAKADYVMSGDRHLLELSSYEGIPILTVRQFLEETEIES
jgi:uncharacterized protein